MWHSPTHWYTSVCQPAKILIPKLAADTGCYLKELPKPMAKEVHGICVQGMP